MILVEVKREDGALWETRLYNMSWNQFRKMADAYFVAIGKSVEIDSDMLIKQLRANFNWDEYNEGEYTKKSRATKDEQLKSAFISYNGE